MIFNFESKAEGTAKPSFISECLEHVYNENYETEEDLDDIKGAAAAIYAAGADTVSFIYRCFSLRDEVYQPECCF